MSITKRQHYVWRNYLRAWADNDVIWTYLKKQNKVIKTDLMNVAQEGYFYKLECLTDFEKKYLIHHISQSSKTIQGLQHEILSSFILFTEISKNLNAISTDDLQRRLKDIEMNTVEKFHGRMESYGTKLIACRSFEDILFLRNAFSRFDTLSFICFQYFRTKQMRDRLIATYEGPEHYNPERMWKILSLLIPINAAMNTSLHAKLRFLFLENKSETKFITSDQPVINIVGDNADEQGIPKDIEFYYPLSPECALIVDFSSMGSGQFQNISVSKEMADWFNKQQLANYDNYIFADNENQLSGVAANNGD